MAALRPGQPPRRRTPTCFLNNDGTEGGYVVRGVKRDDATHVPANVLDRLRDPA